MGKNLTIDTPVVGDALLTLREMLPQIHPSEHPTWLAQIDEWKAESNERDILSQEIDDLIAPQVMRELWHATNEGDCTVVSDVGQHQMWEAQYFLHTKRRSLLTSGGLGTMGYALPAAIGAQVGRPEEEMWVVAGDGGFQMTMPELSTVVQERLPIKIALINNGYLGMVRQWQDIFYNKRYSGTPLFNPDFVKVAEAYGIPGRAVTRKEDVYQAIKEAQATDGPFLLDFQVDELTNVFPMVAAGGSNVDMIRRPFPATEVDD
jgi:acetolactate synthase-1/2/3 large subunit